MIAQMALWYNRNAMGRRRNADQQKLHVYLTQVARQNEAERLRKAFQLVLWAASKTEESGPYPQGTDTAKRSEDERSEDKES
jgi:hypothetical protein